MIDTRLRITWIHSIKCEMFAVNSLEIAGGHLTFISVY